METRQRGSSGKEELEAEVEGSALTSTPPAADKLRPNGEASVSPDVLGSLLVFSVTIVDVSPAA
jgi:hypothetical protein